MSDKTAALSPFGVKTRGFTAEDLPSEAHSLLWQKGTTRRYRRGQEVQRRAEVPPQVSWQLQGRLRCPGLQPDGAEQHGGWIMEQELFGVNSVLLGCPSRFTMTVDMSEALVLHFSRDLLLEMMQTIPEVGVGASRQRVHVELQNLRDQGQLELGYRKVILRPNFFSPNQRASIKPL
jgi:hypothetical protein